MIYINYTYVSICCKGSTCAATGEISAEDIYRMLVADGVGIGLATVYRVLTQFEQAGLLKRNALDTNRSNSYVTLTRQSPTR